MIALIGNLDLAELLVIALVSVMIFGRNLPRVAATAVSNVTKARRALQKVWRESGIGDEIRDVQRELDTSARRLRDADPRTAYRTANREIEAAVAKPVTTNAEEATDDPDYGRAQAEAEAAAAAEEASESGGDESAEARGGDPRTRVSGAGRARSGTDAAAPVVSRQSLPALVFRDVGGGRSAGSGGGRRAAISPRSRPRTRRVMFRLGYNTNGLAHHRLTEALDLLAELGYRAVALTPDVGHLDPYRSEPAERRAIAEQARDLGLEVVVETGARFLLDAARKHFPTLLEEEAADRARRVEFLRRCTDLAAELGAGVVSTWSGAAPDGSAAEGEEPPPERHWDHLCSGLEAVLAHAAERSVRVAFEPEPGMFIERPSGYRELVRRLGPLGDSLGLTLDVGHLLCTGDLPVERVIVESGERLWNVHLDDISGGVHDHRMFGTGDLDLPRALNALMETGYGGVASVELSRDSHRGPIAATEAMTHLQHALRFSP